MITTRINRRSATCCQFEVVRAGLVALSRYQVISGFRPPRVPAGLLQYRAGSSVSHKTRGTAVRIRVSA